MIIQWIWTCCPLYRSDRKKCTEFRLLWAVLRYWSDGGKMSLFAICSTLFMFTKLSSSFRVEMELESLDSGRVSDFEWFFYFYFLFSIQIQLLNYVVCYWFKHIRIVKPNLSCQVTLYDINFMLFWRANPFWTAWQKVYQI